MLSEKQLKDAKKCNEKCVYGDTNCSLCDIGYSNRDCLKATAKTALHYKAKYDKAMDMLKSLKWVKDDIAGHCPICGGGKEWGHKPDCELAALLKEGETGEL